MMYDECPDCGASLDPGEKCDCQSEAKKKSLCPVREKHRQCNVKQKNIFTQLV